MGADLGVCLADTPRLHALPRRAAGRGHFGQAEGTQELSTTCF